MRLIDADALIEVLGRNNIVNIVTVYDKTIMEHIKDAPTIEAEPVRHGEWISVKEQMPPTGNAVLVAVHNANMAWRCVEIDIWDGNWIENPDSEWHIVTHWMPLPELPGMDGGA